jgi:hypothetical protein
MKKNSVLQIVTLIFLFSTEISKAQTQESKSPIKIGAKIGYSLGKLSNENSNIYTHDYESIDGLDLGIIIEFPQTDRVSIQTEINFTHRGGHRNGIQPVTGNELSDQLNQFLPFFGMPLVTDENPLYADFENESDLNYLEFPVLVKFGWGSDVRFYTEIGSYVGILLNATQHTKGLSQFYFDSQATSAVFFPNPNGPPPTVELPEQSLDADTNVKDNLRTVNFGGIIGIGATKKIGARSELFIDARASYSFGAIQFHEVFGKSHIGGIIFSVGYSYELE